MNEGIEKQRIHSLDYLRGLAALGITIFHYSTWALNTKFESDTVIQKIGIYGVSLFYILSGLTLYIVYHDRLYLNLASLKDFYIKRVFRIFPLLWIATLLTIVFGFETLPSSAAIALNITGLFGFLDWDSAIGVGVWSIGNELVFYAIFPILLFLAKQLRILFAIALCFLLWLYLYFAFVILDPSINLTSQWENYVNPFNQAFLFVVGFLMGHFSKKIFISQRLTLAILLVAVLLFVFIPVKGDPIHLVTGFERLVYTVICFLICFCFYKNSFVLPSLMNAALRKLGESSYSLYLLHPIINLLVLNALQFLDPFFYIGYSIKVIISFAFALLLSYLNYITFEKFFQSIGKKVVRSSVPQPV